MTSHPGKRISFYDMAAIFGTAFLRSATVEKAANGFKACGLWPLDDNIFGDDEFAAAAVTDEAPPTNATSMPCNVSQAGCFITQVTAVNEQARSTANDHSIDADPIPGPSGIHHNAARTSLSDEAATRHIIKQLSPLPKIAAPRPRTRKVESAACLTSSPCKRLLIEKEETRQKKSTSVRRTSGNKGKKRLAKRLETPSSGTGGSDEDMWPCLICGEPFSNSKPRERWVQCAVCKNWAHDSVRQATQVSFVRTVTLTRTKRNRSSIRHCEICLDVS